eukprot:CAMPEP_0171511000 /NCGR_PEP_ID=MMETSP0959-20130129/724_1 /TAXON_ID=87120 /ORGANISM="Aurantiochytrium limacinum, Strain ATCCMYA-1381" /LENGTH=351 /DNA_ID=CAMNT_0012048523 /DNA_START=197 /DNA_END=1254 /DNA_ORIENTATION=-
MPHVENTTRPGWTSPTPTSSYTAQHHNSGVTKFGTNTNNNRTPGDNNAISNDVQSEHKREHVRKTGFERPWTYVQMLSWVMYPFFVCLYYVVSRDPLRGPIYYVMCAVHSVLALAVLWFAVRCSCLDPEDDVVDLHDLPQHERAIVTYANAVCEDLASIAAHVINVFHILITIVYGFNIASEARELYKFFLPLSHGDAHVAIRNFYWAFRAYFIANGILLATDSIGRLVIAAVYFFATLITSGSIGNLLLFHIRLVYRSQTTYEFLVEKARNARADQQAQQQRAAAAGAQGSFPARRRRCLGICGAANQIGGTVSVEHTPSGSSSGQHNDQSSGSRDKSGRNVSEGQIHLV